MINEYSEMLCQAGIETEQNKLSKEKVQTEVTQNLEKLLIAVRNNDNREGYYPEIEYSEIEQRVREANGTSDPTQKQKLLAKYDSTKLATSIQEIKRIEYEDSEVEILKQLNEILNENPEITKGITLALLQFYRDRLTALGVTELTSDAHLSGTNRLRQKAIEHSEEVVNIAQQGPPLVVIAAAIHDISKVTTNGVNLGLHEAGSASMVKGIVEKVFTAATIEKEIVNRAGESSEVLAAVTRYMQLAVASHGKDEFPYKTAANNPIDEKRGLYKLFTGVYASGYVPPTDYGEKLTEENKQYLQKMIDGVREADMTSALTLNSFAKIIAEANEFMLYKRPNAIGKEPAIVNNNSLLEYFMTLAPTLYEYLRDMPNAYNMKAGYALEIQKSALMFALAIASANETEDAKKVLNLFAAQIPHENMLALQQHITELQAIFEEGKNKTKEEQKSILTNFKTKFSELQKSIDETLLVPVQEDDETMVMTFITETLPKIKYKIENPDEY